ncbi:MAG: WbqC family protein, partial [Alistipes sp.]
HFLAHSLQEVLSYLHINTEILISSDLHKDCSLKGKEKVLHICELLHAESYFNAIGGQELYDKAEFAQRGVDLRFLQSNIEPYKQLKGDFVPCLSMIDVLMYNSPET